MSKLFKSKLLLGAMIVAAVFVAVGVVSPKSAAASTTCSITSTLRVGSKGAQVACLQTAVGVTADGSFGPMTKAAVVKWQASVGLTADGVFGPKSLAAWMSLSGTSTLPAGCTSTAGFSSTTGQPCNTGVTTTLPPGCTSTAGFSPTTGQNCSTGTTVTSGTGPLSVSLASDNPASGNLIQGQATADLAHYMFTGTGTLTQVTLQRTGISDNSVFPNVYLYNGSTRLSDSASVNSLGQIVFNGLNIPVSGSLDLSVRADIVGGTANESTVQVTLTSYMVAGSTTASTVNLAGNSFFISSGTGILSTVTVGTQTVSAQSVSAGTQQLALWSAPINVSLHSVWLKSASFDVIGSVPSNAFANLGLFANGVKVATATGINSMGYVTFDLTAAPYSLPTGATTLEVRGDIVNGSSRTVQLSLQHASDLMVTDSQVGANVAVTNQGSSTFSINQGGLITISQGTLVAQADTTFNSQTNVTGGASNVAIASWKLTSYGEDVKVNTVTVQPTITPSTVAACQTSASSIGLENVTLYYNGAPVGSSQNGTLSANCVFNTLTFTPGSSFTIAGGTSGIFQVRADIINGAGTPTYSSGAISANVAITQYQGVSSGQTGSLSLSGSTTMNIATGTLTVAKNASFLDQTVNPNTSGAHIGSFTLQNQSTSEGVQVNSLVVGLYSNSAGTVAYSPITNFSTLTLSTPSGSLGSVTPIGQPTGTGNTFSTNFTIPAGGSVTVDVWANLGSSVSPADLYTALGVTAVGANSRVPISNTAVVGQHITLGVGTLANPALVTSQSTNAQYISSGSTGATNAAQETYNFVATSGTATITGLKFAALTSLAPTATTVAASAIATTATGVNIPVTSSTGILAGDNILITTNGIYGGQDAVAHVTAVPDGTDLTVNVTTPMVTGWDTAAHQAAGGSTGAGTPAFVYQLAATGATGVALNSPNVASGSATFNGGIAFISAITGASGNGIAVPNNPSGVTVPVYVSYAPVNTNGGVASGTTSKILLEYVQYQTGSTTTYFAPTDTTATGTTITLVGSKPNLSLASSGTTPTATSDLLLGTVTVAADNTGDVYIKQIPLQLSINSGTSGTANITSVKLTDTNDVTLAAFTPGTCTAAANSSSGNCLETWTAGSYYRISAGQSKTFEVRATIAGSFGTSASVSFGLGTSSTFLWGDVNGGATASTGATLTGQALYSYPNSSVSIHN